MILLLAAGIAGALARLVASDSPKRWRRAMVTDALIGGVSSVLVPAILGSLPFTGPIMARLDSPGEQAVLVASSAYIASHIWVNRLGGWLRSLGDRYFKGGTS